MVTANILQRTFLVSHGDESGTAFTIEKEGRQYLISARHVFESIEDQADVTINIFHNNQWKDLTCKATIHPNEQIDIIIFAYDGVVLGNLLPVIYTMDGITIGQDAFFLGFPYGRFSPDDHRLNNLFPFPFVKKATVSAFDLQDSGILYLDGHTNPGFSGGPIVFIDRITNELKVCGVMRGYLAHEGRIDNEYVNEEGELESDYLTYDENSGIIKVHRIDEALVLLDKIISQS